MRYSQFCLVCSVQPIVAGDISLVADDLPANVARHGVEIFLKGGEKISDAVSRVERTRDTDLRSGHV